MPRQFPRESIQHLVMSYQHRPQRSTCQHIKHHCPKSTSTNTPNSIPKQHLHKNSSNCMPSTTLPSTSQKSLPHLSPRQPRVPAFCCSLLERQAWQAAPNAKRRNSKRQCTLEQLPVAKWVRCHCCRRSTLAKVFRFSEASAKEVTTMERTHAS